MVIAATYALFGIVFFGGWSKFSTEAKTAYSIIFPLHAIIGVWIHTCVSHRGKFLDSPFWYGVLVVILLIILVCGR